jgi:hypothetical protein
VHNQRPGLDRRKNGTQVVFHCSAQRRGRSARRRRQPLPAPVPGHKAASSARDGASSGTRLACPEPVSTLLQAAVERLAELTSTDMLGSAAMLDSATAPPLPGHDLDRLAGVAAALVESWLTTGQERQLARYELSLEATRRPELRQTLVTTGAAIRAVVADLLAAAGVREPHQRAADFAAFIDGLLFDQIAGAGSRELTTADLRAAIATLLAAVTSRRS